MNPIFLIAAVLAWLIAVLSAWAFVHGAQILRRQELASLGVVTPLRTARAIRYSTEGLTSIDPVSERFPDAA